MRTIIDKGEKNWIGCIESYYRIEDKKFEKFNKNINIAFFVFRCSCPR